jgi:mitogen-activated protein kinase kinase 1
MSPERICNRPYSYLSDIWSFGLVLIESATGKYPFEEQPNCIEMAQTILDADIVPLSDEFTPNFRDFVRQCIHRDPSMRLPAEILLGAPWLQQHGAISYETSVEIVCDWIHKLTGK